MVGKSWQGEIGAFTSLYFLLVFWVLGATLINGEFCNDYEMLLGYLCV
jgi:hypothetical protein